MNTAFKIEAAALVNRLLNDTPEEELLRLIEEAEEGVHRPSRVCIFCEITSASTFSAKFQTTDLGSLEFPIFSFSSRVGVEQAANYEDLALAA